MIWNLGLKALRIHTMTLGCEDYWKITRHKERRETEMRDLNINED